MYRSSGYEFVTATAAALVLAIVVSWGAIYALNRILGPDDPYETAGIARILHPPD